MPIKSFLAALGTRLSLSLTLATTGLLISPIALVAQAAEFSQELDDTPLDETPLDETPPEDSSPEPEASPETPDDDQDIEPTPASDTQDPQLLNPFNSPFSQQNFVPDISLILDSSLGFRSVSNDAFKGQLSPFRLAPAFNEHHVDNLNNGFNLNYAELTLSSAIDPNFDLFTTFHLSDFEIEIEEAYFNTRGLPGNIQVKGGKFLSHFGRLNAQHAHFWSFNDAPMVYRHFLGNEHLNELGARVSWLAPTDFYLDLGLEVLQGGNTNSFGTKGFEVGDQKLEEVNLPNLIVGTVKASWDLLDNFTLLSGLSYAQGGTRWNRSASASADAHVHQVNNASFQTFAGGSQLFGADLNLRYFFDSYSDLNWQSEFLWRNLSGSSYDAQGRHALTSSQSGLYSQILWRFAQQWRTGIRLDLMTHDILQSELVSQQIGPQYPRYTAMLEFLPSEFSRFRLQYNLEQGLNAENHYQMIHGLFLNLNLVMGAHGAHQF